MLVRVKKPRIDMTDDEMKKDVLGYLNERYADVEILSDDDDDYVDYFESETYKRIQEITNGGEMLKAYRERAGLTQTELAKRIGISQPNVNAMERGSRPIGKEMAARLANVLDAPREVLLR